MTGVLAIGLDSMDRLLLERWMDDGTLPMLSKLRRQGVFGAMSPPPGLGNNAAWPSFFTGSSPAKHGRYGYRMVSSGSYHTGDFRPTDYRNEPFWNALSKAGRRVAIIDVPKSPLAEELNGIQLADWTLHDPIYSKPCSLPSGWASDVIKQYGSDTVEDCDGHNGGERQIRHMRDALLRRIEQKTRLVCNVLKKEDWDLVATVFADSHCAGHHFWHLLDPRHPAYQSDLSETLGDCLREVYVALDTAVARLLESAGTDKRVLVFSAMGMGPNYSGHDLLYEILSRFEKAMSTSGERFLAALDQIKHRIPLRLRRRLGPLLKDQVVNVLLAEARGNRLCFAEPHNDIMTGIRINVRGREPKGRVAPGKEYEDICLRLKEQLAELINLDSNQPAVVQVIHSRELYPDALPGELPDLFVEWNNEAPIVRIGSQDIGLVARTHPLHRTGDHTCNGFFLAAGPGLAPCESTDPVTVFDLAPTIAAWLDVPLPGIDGAQIAALNTVL